LTVHFTEPTFVFAFLRAAHCVVLLGFQNLVKCTFPYRQGANVAVALPIVVLVNIVVAHQDILICFVVRVSLDFKGLAAEDFDDGG
jgi:hypothetical protein